MPANADVQNQPLSWTDWADLVVESDVVLAGTVDTVQRQSGRDAADVPAGEVRALVVVRLQTLLQAPAVFPEKAGWLWQGPASAKGKPWFQKGDSLLVFAKRLAGSPRPDLQALQLPSRAAQQPWSADAEATVRAILQQLQQNSWQNMLVTGVESAFHSSGDVPGASESQFFLTSSSGRPLALIVRRFPDKAPEVRLSTGDLLDQAEPIRPRTLLWRALACGLPAQPTAVTEAPLVADYQLAKEIIGPCGRTLPGHSH